MGGHLINVDVLNDGDDIVFDMRGQARVVRNHPPTVKITIRVEHYYSDLIYCLPLELVTAVTHVVFEHEHNVYHLKNYPGPPEFPERFGTWPQGLRALDPEQARRALDAAKREFGE
jgi:hypothetical protein